MRARCSIHDDNLTRLQAQKLCRSRERELKSRQERWELREDNGRRSSCEERVLLADSGNGRLIMRGRVLEMGVWFVVVSVYGFLWVL